MTMIRSILFSLLIGLSMGAHAQGSAAPATQHVYVMGQLGQHTVVTDIIQVYAALTNNAILEQMKATDPVVQRLRSTSVARFPDAETAGTELAEIRAKLATTGKTVEPSSKFR